jgi:hypothetical protein
MAMITVIARDTGLSGRINHHFLDRSRARRPSLTTVSGSTTDAMH